MTRLEGFVRTRSSAAGVFLVSFVILLVFMDLRVGSYDEGIILTGAWHVWSGAVPHRDFYANYGPAQFYVVAALFDLFGASSTPARIYDIAIRAAIVAVAFRAVAVRCRPWAPFIAAAICLLWMIGSRFYLYPVFPVLFLALLGTHWLSPAEAEQPGVMRLVGAGALTGLAALFRYDMGALLLLAHMAALGAGHLFHSSARDAAGALFRNALAYGAGTAAVFLPPATLLLWAGLGPGFLHDIVEFSIPYYAEMRGKAFPGPAELATMPTGPVEAAVYLPFATALLAAVAILRRGSSEPHARPPADRRFLLTFGLLVTAMALKGTVRVTAIHMIAAIVTAVVLIVFLIDRSARLPRPLTFVAWMFALLAAGTGAYSAASVGYLFLGDPGRSFGGAQLGIGNRERGVAGSGSVTVAPNLPSLAAARMPPDAACAAELVAAHSLRHESIFVATMRHDRLVANRVELYFAAGRRAGTHWYHFDPGLQTRVDIQRLIIADLQENSVHWIIRDTSYDDWVEANQSAVSSGVHLLDRYLAETYRPVARFGEVSVWLRRDRPIPATLRGWTCRTPLRGHIEQVGNISR